MFLFLFFVFDLVGAVGVVNVIFVSHKNLTLKFGQNWVNDIVVVVFTVSVLLLLIQKPKYQTWSDAGQ